MGSADAVGMLRIFLNRQSFCAGLLLSILSAHACTAMIARNSTSTAMRERYEIRSWNIRHSAVGKRIRHGGLVARTGPRELRDLVHAAGAGEIRPRPGNGAFILLSGQRPGLHRSRCRRPAMRDRV